MQRYTPLLLSIQKILKFISFNSFAKYILKLFHSLFFCCIQWNIDKKQLHTLLTFFINISPNLCLNGCPDLTNWTKIMFSQLYCHQDNIRYIKRWFQNGQQIMSLNKQLLHFDSFILNEANLFAIWAWQATGID